jgi:hypothetical protein
MVKKLTLLAAAVAVLALAVPAFASATVLTMPSETKVPTGTLIKGVSTDTVTTTPLGELTCESVEVQGTVTVNNGTTVEGTGNGTSKTANCFVEPEHEPLTVEKISLTNLKSSVTGQGTASFSFVAQLPGELECKFSGTVPGTFVEGTGTLNLTGHGLVGSPTICGTEKEVTFKGDFPLTTGDGTGVILD